MRLDTLIPLIRVDSALRSFPEQKNFATVDNQTRGRVSPGPKKDNRAGGRAAKRSRTIATTDGHGTGGRLVPVTTKAQTEAEKKCKSTKRAPTKKNSSLQVKETSSPKVGSN